MSITLKKLIAASIALLVTAAMQAITIPEGVTVYRGAATAGTAVSSLTDGHKYLIYDSNSSQGTAFRYASPTTSPQIAGTTCTTPTTSTLNYGPQYVWVATCVSADEGTWQFKNELYGTYIACQSYSNNSYTIQLSDTPTTYTVTFTDSEAKVKDSENAEYAWDGNYYGYLVGWKGDGHPYQFYEVGEENGVDYCYYSSKTIVDGEEVHSSDKTLTKASDIASPVTTENGITITSSVADDGSLALTGELKGIDPITVTIKNKQGGVYVTATATGLTCSSATNTDDANKLALYPTSDDQRTFYIYSPTQKMFVTTIGYNTGTAVGLGDAPDAKLLVLGVESDHTETICDAANTGSFYYWNWRSSNVGTWQNSSSAVGSHWYTILSDDTFAANTAEGVVDAFDAAIVNAQTTVETLQAVNVDASELQTIIAEAQAALIGRNDFAAITEKLTKKTEELLAANAKASLYAAISTASGIYIAHNTPGYLPVETTENVTLKEKLDAAQKVFDKEDATSTEISEATSALTEATNAMTAKIAGLSGSETRFYTGSLYRINNPVSDRGYIYYNSANDTYPWATSKTAYSGNSDDDAMLFGFIEKDGAYYCYNVGSGRFLGIGTGTFNTQSPNKTWTWEVIEPAAITLTSSAKNSYPYLEISRGDVHMSISNAFVGPIVSYYETTDAGVPMLFEYVREATDDEIAKIQKLFEKDGQIEYFENAFAAMAENVNSSAANDGETAGESTANENQLGCYSESTITAAKEAISAAIKAEGATSASVKAVYDNYVSQWNQPEVDAVYTIASYHSTGETYRYLYNNNGTLAVSTDEDVYGKLNYKYWKWSKIPVVTSSDSASSAPAAADVDADEETDGTDGTDGTGETEDNTTYTYGFTNTIEDTTIYLAAKNNDGQNVTISLDANVPGCVNLYDTNTYVMVMNSGSTIDRANTATLDNASGQFVVTKVNDASSVTTAIREVTTEADATAGAIYDLQGRRVSAPTHTGLYIVGGKTTLIRK
jgi:hypothetical protein